jgi:glycosyltransferase involved in cell wall biosynthesis
MNFNGKHILLLCSRLDFPAGIERAIVNSANLFITKGNRVSIFILDETDKIFFPLNNSVAVFSYKLNFGITKTGNTITRKLAFLRHLGILKNKLKQAGADIIIATEYQFSIAAQMVLKNEEVKLYSWEHHHFYHLKRSRFWKTLFKKFYPKIDTVVCLNAEEAESFKTIGCNTCVIPNFSSFSSTDKAALDHKQILTVGWLTKIKGTDLIPAIAKKSIEKYPHWKWKIIGDGEEKKKLENSSGSIVTTDPVLNIEEEYRNTSIYVLPSRFECFPMVLLEAMSVGIPCIAFDCPTGPRHIIKNGEDGILVERENTEAMADAIIELIENEEKRKKMGTNAFENIKRFSPETIYQLWENLFNAE